MKIPVIMTHKALGRLNQLLHDQMRQDSYEGGQNGVTKYVLPNTVAKARLFRAFHQCDARCAKHKDLCRMRSPNRFRADTVDERVDDTLEETFEDLQWEMQLDDLKAARFPIAVNL